MAEGHICDPENCCVGDLECDRCTVKWQRALQEMQRKLDAQKAKAEFWEKACKTATSLAEHWKAAVEACAYGHLGDAQDAMTKAQALELKASHG